MAIIHSRTFGTLICSPQLHGTPAKCGDGFYRAKDVLALAAHTRDILEIEFMLPCGAGLPSDGEPSSPALLSSPLELCRLRLECNDQPDFLRNLLGRAHKLEYLDIYTEQFTTAEDAFSAVTDEVDSALVMLKYVDALLPAAIGG